MPSSLPIGIYVRVSKRNDREDERFHSPREQAERASALAIAKGFVPGPVFEDIDVSGATAPAERPAMGRLLEEIKSGHLAGIAAFSLDRLSREPAHGDALVRMVTKAGGVILTPDMPDAIDSPTGEFTFGMLLQVARLYRSQSKARFAAATERATLAGIPVGRIPFGYRRGEDRVLEVDPEAAAIVRALFERRAAGEQMGPLTRFMDESTGSAWSVQGVRDLLRNRIYTTGRLEYGGVVSEVDAGAIVDEPLWHAAQVIMPRRPPRSGDGWLLSGLLKCSTCGNNLAPWTGGKSKSGERPRRYRCQNRKCPARVSVQAERMERFVVLQSVAVGDELATRSEASDLADLEEALAIAERRLEQVMGDGAADDLGELWAPEVRRRREARDAALTALGEARVTSGVPSTDFRLRDVWEDMSPADRRSALSLFWKAIVVSPKGDGGHPIKFVARGPGGEVEVGLEEAK